MTDEQIIKALECCMADSGYTCKDCPCCDAVCVDIYEVLALIKRQKAEIERLTERLEREAKCQYALCGKIVDLQEQLKAARADAVREFAERVKAHTRHLFSGVDVANIVDDLVKREMTEG